ncbi:hypothetical protein [Paraburkholderia sp. RL17-373-BIF-A]|uniref:hypothetical protein n=1 Tax=Paraburkholderia sp. RL17-373-BIF-A TaxID=3031629 RepID=UPI0038B88790
MPVTVNTLRRAFTHQSSFGNQHTTNVLPIGVHNMAVSAGRYGNVGGIGDLLLSMLTFGIYSLVKLHKMDQKKAAVEQAIKDIHQTIEQNPNENTISVEVEGKRLSVSQYTAYGSDMVSIRFDENQVITIRDANLATFREQLGREISLLR